MATPGGVVTRSKAKALAHADSSKDVIRLCVVGPTGDPRSAPCHPSCPISYVLEWVRTTWYGYANAARDEETRLAVPLTMTVAAFVAAGGRVLQVFYRPTT